jgi:hypothetical protein
LLLVPLKLLPYDNKNEYQVIVDMPEGTTLLGNLVITLDPIDEQSAGTVRAKIETVISPLITATISSIDQVERMYIPLDAVTQVGQLDFVIVKTEKGSARQYVRLGAPGGDERIEVVSGLSYGEQILIPDN